MKLIHIQRSIINGTLHFIELLNHVFTFTQQQQQHRSWIFHHSVAWLGFWFHACTHFFGRNTPKIPTDFFLLLLSLSFWCTFSIWFVQIELKWAKEWLLYDNNDLWCVGTRYVITVYPKEWRWRRNQGTYVWEWCWIYIETCSNKARSSYLTYGKYMCRRQVKPRTMKKILDEEYKCEYMKLTAAQAVHTRCKWAWSHQPKRQTMAKFSASDNHLQIPQAQTSFRNPWKKLTNFTLTKERWQSKSQTSNASNSTHTHITAWAQEVFRHADGICWKKWNIQSVWNWIHLDFYKYFHRCPFLDGFFFSSSML